LSEALNVLKATARANVPLILNQFVVFQFEGNAEVKLASKKFVHFGKARNI